VEEVEVLCVVEVEVVDHEVEVEEGDRSHKRG
jgi:hypothetical protein